MKELGYGKREEGVSREVSLVLRRLADGVVVFA